MKFPHKLRDIVNKLVPELTEENRNEVEFYLRGILEGKDLGAFKGEISVFKQRELDKQKLPASQRRKLEKTAKSKLDKLVGVLERKMTRILKKFKHKDEDKRISKTRFRDDMKAVLRLAYTDAYKLGTRTTGLKKLSGHLGVDERKWLDKVFAQEQRYFNKFLTAVVKGESVNKAKVRIKNYARAVNSVFESSKVMQLPHDVIIYWVLESDNPCPDCKFLHKHSPYTKDTLPTTPKGGSTRCLSNCYCRLRIVKGSKSRISSINRKQKNAKSMLIKLQWNRKHVKSKR